MFSNCANATLEINKHINVFTHFKTSKTLLSRLLKSSVTPKFDATKLCSDATERLKTWWSQAGSNRRPPACKAGALPAELWPHDLSFFRLAALQFVLARLCTVCTLPRSLKLRLASQKKSCVIVLSESDKGYPFCSDCSIGVPPHSLLCKVRGSDELREMVGLGRFELPTSPLSGVRSNQLSYRPAGCCCLSDNL